MKSLIVDSDPADCKLLQEILADFGECQTLDTGNAAVAAVEKAMEAGAPFELITLEVVLSDMDGTEALFEIRDMEEEWGIGEEEKAVIVMVTAIVDRNTIPTAFSAGCDDYVVKPFDNKGIIQRFRKSRLRHCHPTGKSEKGSDLPPLNHFPRQTRIWQRVRRCRWGCN